MILERDLDSAAQALHHSPFTLAFEQSERELGERLGYPALVYAPAPKDDTFDIGPAEYDAKLDWAYSQIVGLRKQLASADEHIGALLGAIENQRAAEDAVFQAAYATDVVAAEADLEDAVASAIIAENAARAFLRRRAK